MQCVILSLDRAGNGPIGYDPAAKLPPEHPGYERSRDQPYVFLPLYPLCTSREMTPNVRPCGSIIPWMTCREPRARLSGRKVVPDQCWECPFSIKNPACLDKQK